MTEKYDVVICGGGLAGLTLARQLTREVPSASVAVVEPTRRPLPEACLKVGESCVEMGAHYFAEILGMKDYLDEEHLRKNGLRFFVGPEGTPLHERTEFGPSEPPIIPSYQTDRGKFENDLRAMVEEDGVTLLEGYAVRDVTLGAGDADHEVEIVERRPDGTGAEARSLHARFVVDAMGRRRLLQRKLGLARESGIKHSSAWFRVKGIVKVGQLVDESHERWHTRDVDGTRWLSTVHLMGLGYWVWLIPMSTGHTSIGIVTDHEHHDFLDYNRPAKARDWIREHEPELSQHLDSIEFEDFLVMHDFAHGSAQVYSSERWACVGEAGAFVDPFYSPGSDFVGLANCLAAELIREMVETGRNDPKRAELFNQFYLGWGADMGEVLGNNALIFSNHDVLGAKLWWDFYVYWTFMARIFFRKAYKQDAAGLEEVLEIGKRYSTLNRWAQRLFVAWAELKQVTMAPGRAFCPLPMFPSILADKHLELREDRSVEQTLADIRADLGETEALLGEVLMMALRGVTSGNAAELAERIGLSEWDISIDPGRVDAESLPRPDRVKKLPAIVRDLERSLGVWGPEAGDLSELLELASVKIAVPAGGPAPISHTYKFPDRPTS